MPKRLAGIDVGDMHLDAGDIDGRQRIAQRDAGMGKRSRINNDELGTVLSGLMDRFDHFLLSITLQAGETRAGALSFGH